MSCGGFFMKWLKKYFHPHPTLLISFAHGHKIILAHGRSACNKVCRLSVISTIKMQNR